MSSDEDFSLVVEPTEETVEGIRALIQNEKEKFSQVEQEQKDLEQSIRETQGLTQQFRDRTVALQRDLDQDQARTKDQEAQDEERLLQLKEEEERLRMELDQVLTQISEEEETTEKLRSETNVFGGAPERPLEFRGLTQRADEAPLFHMETELQYPLEGGTALITFEDEAVAQRLVSGLRHRVDLGGDFYMNVEARRVSLLLPSALQVQSQVCPSRVLVSLLPQMDRQTLEDKLFIHFSRSRNGGGEVDECHLQDDSGTAVISFMQDDIAKHLTEVEFHDVKLSEGSHRVRVSPYVTGTITHLQSRSQLCRRTVLFCGIPDIADAETLQDLLEIHFQKRTSGGGEIEAILYCPQGHTRTAIFQTPRKEREGERGEGDGSKK